MVEEIEYDCWSGPLEKVSEFCIIPTRSNKCVRIRDTDGSVLRHETHIDLSTKVVDCEGLFGHCIYGITLTPV
jgi:hypothetical protein